MKVWFGWWVGGPVWSAEHRLVSRLSGDVPAVFVDKPVMRPAEQNQVVQVGGPTVGPVLNVVDL